ncbi:MAG: ParA family protein [Candidatus Microthrix sp.]|nr:ParA family protein [Candidatus Microthrix sp.]MBK7019612.1 ParA family protein [Candidatus Microthrix sp.]
MGKTSWCWSPAMAGAVRAGRKALVIDLDPQGSATWCLGVDADDDYWTSADVLERPSVTTAHNALVTSGWGEGVDVVAASASLVRGDGGDPLSRVTSLVPVVAELATGYDLTLVDCAPSLGAITTLRWAPCTVRWRSPNRQPSAVAAWASCARRSKRSTPKPTRICS